VDITQDVIDQNDEEDDADVGVPALKLPTCDLSHLDEIAAFFVSCLVSPIKRERLSVAIESDGYIRKLTDVFHSCEDAGNVDALHRLYGVFKSIFLLNKTALFEVLYLPVLFLHSDINVNRYRYWKVMEFGLGVGKL